MLAAKQLSPEITQYARKQLVAGAFRRRLPFLILRRPCVYRLVLVRRLLMMLPVRAMRKGLTLRVTVVAAPAFLLAVLLSAIAATAVSFASGVAVPVAIAAATTVTVAVTLLLAAGMSARLLALVALRLMMLRRL